MIEESSSFFKENPSETSTTILKVHSSGINLDAQHTILELHDEDNFQHLALSYFNNQLTFQMLSTYQQQSESQKYLCAEQIQFSKDVQLLLSQKFKNLPLKQLKMTRCDLSNLNQDYIYGNECQEPESPKFACATPTTPVFGNKQTYLAVAILETEIVVLKFEILTKKEQNKYCHSIDEVNVNSIQFEGKVGELFINKQREHIIVRINYEQSTKIHLIEKITGQHAIRDIATYQNDSDIIIGQIGVSSEFAVIRVITKSQKKFFINVLFVNHIGQYSMLNYKENTTIKVQTNKKPLTSLMNENNYRNCQTLFSQTSSYLVISDGQNIEVQDFNNISQKNVIKEYQPKNNGVTNSQLNKPQKIMYNLEKSTLLIANSSVNQFITLYNYDNPISILEPIYFTPSEPTAIKSVIISSVPQQNATPSSATSLMETFSHFKNQICSNQILALAFLEDNSIVPFTVDKEILDMKVPELKFVSSQITSMYNYDDSQNFFNDFEAGFPKHTKNTFDVFKTPDRKASFTFLNSSLENNKFYFSSSMLPSNSNSYPANNNNNNNNSQINQNIIFQSQQRPDKSLNFDHPGTNKERERSVSQESNSSRNFSAYKPSINGSILNNKKTLFNENSNTLCTDDNSYQIHKANRKEKDVQADPTLLDKISPTQQKINEMQNSSDSEESEIHYSRPKQFKLDAYEGSPLLAKQKMSNRFIPNSSNRIKDFSRITMKKQKNSCDNIPLPIFNKAEVSQDDIIEPNAFVQKRKNNNFFEYNSQTTQEDIENTYNNQQNSQLSNEISLFSQRKGQQNKQNFNQIDSQNEIKEYENEDISNIQSQELSFNNQQELEQQTISSKKANCQVENNIFDKKYGTPTTTTKVSKVNFSESKSKNNSSKKKAITAFLTTSPSPSPQTQQQILSFYSNHQQLRNSSINQKMYTQNNNSSFSYPNKTYPVMLENIKSLKLQNNQTQQFFNEVQQNTFKNRALQFETKDKQFFDEATFCLQQPIFNNSYFQNNNTQNHNNIGYIPKKNFQPFQQQQQQINQNSQQLLGKRKSSQQQQQQQLLTNFGVNQEPRKLVKKQD